jgi:hypothetical protein
MQICGHDALPIKFSSSPCHDTIQYHIMIPLSPLSLLITMPHQIFCLRGMHDTTYDTLVDKE